MKEVFLSIYDLLLQVGVITTYRVPKVDTEPVLCQVPLSSVQLKLTAWHQLQLRGEKINRSPVACLL